MLRATAFLLGIGAEEAPTEARFSANAFLEMAAKYAAD